MSVAGRVRPSPEPFESARTDIDAWAHARRFDGCRDTRVDQVRWLNNVGLAVHEITRPRVGRPGFCMGTHFEHGARAGYMRVVRRFGDSVIR